MSSRAGSKPEAAQQTPQAHLDPRRRADATMFQRGDVAARDAEIGTHDEKPVHALRQRAEQFGAPPLGKGGRHGMRRARDEIDLPVAQRRVGAVDRVDQLGRDGEPFGREKAQLGRRQRRKIRIRDQVR